METSEWIFVAASTFISGIFVGNIIIPTFRDWIDMERELKAMKGKDDELSR